MRGACPAFHQPCSNRHKNGQFLNVCKTTKKSLNYLDNQNTPPRTTTEDIGVIFGISNKDKNNHQQINNIVEEKDQHLLQNQLCYTS